MSDDYAKATAAGTPVTINGVEYRVSKFGPRDLGDLQAWLKMAVPDPRLMARDLCAGLSDAVALQVWRDLSEQARDWPPSLDSFEGNRLLVMTHEGAAHAVWVALRRLNPSVDLARAREIAKDMSTAEIKEMIAAGFPEPTFDPKSQAETMTTPRDRGPVPIT